MENFEVIKLAIELVVGLLVTPFALVLWWMLRKLVADMRLLERQIADDRAAYEKALSEYKLHVSETYSTKNDLAKAMEQLGRAIEAVFAKLERIEDKLDQKADKAHS